MREIKFRFFHKPTCDDYFLHEDSPMNYGVLDIGGWLRSDDVKNGHVVVMQYTGLKDKNGKDIYEGDVLQYQAKRVLAGGCFPVAWNERRGGWHLAKLNSMLTTLQAKKFVVIGDIYTNPELLGANQ